MKKTLILCMIVLTALLCLFGCGSISEKDPATVVITVESAAKDVAVTPSRSKAERDGNVYTIALENRGRLVVSVSAAGYKTVQLNIDATMYQNNVYRTTVRLDKPVVTQATVTVSCDAPIKDITLSLREDSAVEFFQKSESTARYYFELPSRTQDYTVDIAAGETCEPLSLRISAGEIAGGYYETSVRLVIKGMVLLTADNAYSECYAAGTNYRYYTSKRLTAAAQYFEIPAGERVKVSQSPNFYNYLFFDAAGKSAYGNRVAFFTENNDSQNMRKVELIAPGWVFSNITCVYLKDGTAHSVRVLSEYNQFTGQETYYIELPLGDVELIEYQLRDMYSPSEQRNIKRTLLVKAEDDKLEMTEQDGRWDLPGWTAEEFDEITLKIKDSLSGEAITEFSYNDGYAEIEAVDGEIRVSVWAVWYLGCDTHQIISDMSPNELTTGDREFTVSADRLIELRFELKIAEGFEVESINDAEPAVQNGVYTVNNLALNNDMWVSVRIRSAAGYRIKKEFRLSRDEIEIVEKTVYTAKYPLVADDFVKVWLSFSSDSQIDLWNCRVKYSSSAEGSFLETLESRVLYMKVGAVVQIRVIERNGTAYDGSFFLNPASTELFYDGMSNPDEIPLVHDPTTPLPKNSGS